VYVCLCLSVCDTKSMFNCVYMCLLVSVCVSLSSMCVCMCVHGLNLSGGRAEGDKTSSWPPQLFPKFGARRRARQKILPFEF